MNNVVESPKEVFRAEGAFTKGPLSYRHHFLDCPGVVCCVSDLLELFGVIKEERARDPLPSPSRRTSARVVYDLCKKGFVVRDRHLG